MSKKIVPSFFSVLESSAAKNNHFYNNIHSRLKSDGSSNAKISSVIA